MKKILFILAVFCCAATASAQDTIFKTDAQSIKAKIMEISPSEVRYKRFSNPDGPTYVLPVSDISHIVYQNGERDDFNPVKVAVPEQSAAQPDARTEPQPEPATVSHAVPMTPLEPAVQAAAEPAQTATDGAPVTMLLKEDRRVAVPQQADQRRADIEYNGVVRYRVRPQIGRIYDDNGVRGMVVDLDESGEHGLMISLEESSNPRFMAWTTIRNPYPETGATDKNDGEKNMAAVAKYIADNGLSWDDFPAFKWCRDLGEGWYLPAADELLTVGYRFNGDQRMKFDRKARQQFNNTLKDNGGSKIDPMASYYSSTYSGDGQAVTSTMEVEPPYVISYKAHEKYLVRAVRKF